MWFHLFGFGIGERQKRLELIDDGLRLAGVHPALVPESVKLALIRLKKAELAAAGAAGEGALFEDAAWLFGYCVLGPGEFADAHGDARAAALEARLAAAEADETGDLAGGDAQIVMLALAANLADPAIAERFEVSWE
jgi:hypothetical protein